MPFFLQKLASFCKKKGINTVAMYAKWWNPKYTGYVKSYGIDLALYTVNSPYEAQEYFDEGVNALFTDFLPPEQ
jgi:glycerophosphoryl diester phosphodiesterase